MKGLGHLAMGMTLIFYQTLLFTSYLQLNLPKMYTSSAILDEIRKKLSLGHMTRCDVIGWVESKQRYIFIR
jgi:hypothetical protein